MKVMEDTAQKMKISVKEFFNKCDEICSKLWTSFFLCGKSSTF